MVFESMILGHYWRKTDNDGSICHLKPLLGFAGEPTEGLFSSRIPNHRVIWPVAITCLNYC